MKRVQYHRYGGPEELRLEEAEEPALGRGQVRVRVRSASANPMDWKIRSGEMKMLSGFRFPRGLGHDFAGVVDAVGPGVERVKIGDEVLGVTAISKAGAFAESVVAQEAHVTLKPESVSFEQAAALTIIGLTAWNGLFAKARLKRGQSIFISGCLGGVGRSWVQIASGQGAEVVGSCSAAAHEEALALGVREAVDYRTFDADRFRRRFDVVFDTAGALSLRQCAAMLREHGISLHIVPTAAKLIGCLLSLRHHLVFGNPKPASLTGVTDLADRGVLVPAIVRVVSLSDAVPALLDLEATGLPKGKVVIRL